DAVQDTCHGGEVMGDLPGVHQVAHSVVVRDRAGEVGHLPELPLEARAVHVPAHAVHDRHEVPRGDGTTVVALADLREAPKDVIDEVVGAGARLVGDSHQVGAIGQERHHDSVDQTGRVGGLHDLSVDDDQVEVVAGVVDHLAIDAIGDHRSARLGVLDARRGDQGELDAL